MSTQTINGIMLFQGEEVLHDERPGWSGYAGWLLIGLVGILAMGAGLVVLALVWWHRRTSRYIVTNERVISFGGWGGDRSVECRIDDIQVIGTNRNFLESFVGNGSVSFGTAGAVGGPSPLGVVGTAFGVGFDGIPNYQNVANTVRDIQRGGEPAGQQAADQRAATAD